jgi:hypothetical protein
MRDAAAVLLDASDPQLEKEIRQEVEGLGDARIANLHVRRVGPGAWAAIVSTTGADRDVVRRRLAVRMTSDQARCRATARIILHPMASPRPEGAERTG